MNARSSSQSISVLPPRIEQGSLSAIKNQLTWDTTLVPSFSNSFVSINHEIMSAPHLANSHWGPWSSHRSEGHLPFKDRPVDFCLVWPHESRSQQSHFRRLCSALASSREQPRLVAFPSHGPDQPGLVYKIPAVLPNLVQALLASVSSSSWLALMNAMWLLWELRQLFQSTQFHCAFLSLKHLPSRRRTDERVLSDQTACRHLQTGLRNGSLLKARVTRSIWVLVWQRIA